MGGHGGLNILPQKRWNVYRRDNRLRVHRDEEQHREAQQQQRHRDERQRMSSVLILLRRKKAEAQARRRQRVSAAVGDAKTQLKSVQPSTTNSSLPSSYAAWLSTLVNFSESFSGFGTVSEGVCCVPRRAARCHAAVSDHDRESTVVDNSVLRADPFWTASRGAEVTAGSAAAETSNVLSSGAYCIPPNGCDSALRAVRRSESPEPLLGDDLRVVRVRLPIIARTTAATASTKCSRAPLVSSATVDSATATLQCLSSAASFETGTNCFECGAQEVCQPSAAGQAYHTSSSATFERSPPHQQQQQLAKGEMQHVNFFQAEENELRRLEVRRKKYLLNAGYTPGAYSDFEGEIRKSLTQMPWYYQPPSACSMSKPPASHTTEFLDTSLRHQSQEVLKQVTCDRSKAALTKQRPAATPAAVLAEEDRGEEEQGQEGELCGNGHAPGLKAAPLACGALAAVNSATSLQHVSVHFKESLRTEERHCILRKRDAWPYSESDQNRRGSGETKGKDKSSNTVGRECRKTKPRRIRKDKGTISDTRKAEDDVECLQVMLLVQDEDECTVT